MRGERVRLAGAWAGLMAVLAGVFCRAVCPAEPFPWWEADAFAFAPPLAGLTPAWALFVDVVILLGASVVVICLRGGPGRVGAALLATGLGVVGYHAATDIETVSAGADLAAGIGALTAAWVASSLPGARRVMVGVALGFGVMLAAVGAEDVYIDHPRTVETFERTKDDFYRARGWDPEGREAALYEERLSHADPTGWFGLTNVLATFAGASAVGLLAAALTGIRGERPPGGNSQTARPPARSMPRAGRLALVAGAVASAWVLMLTGSKGAIGAAALAGLVVGVFWVRKRAWVGRAVLVASVLVVAAVGARGLVGERLGERSLLFRSQYQRGTLAVLAESPFVGVGPGRFQDAYTRLKPVEAPEDVTSPHSVAFDWVGLLGIGGLAWVAMLIGGWWLRCGRGAEEEEAPTTRMLVRAAGVIVGVALVVSAATTRQTLAVEGVLALLGGAVGWLAVGGVLVAWGGSLRAAALGAAGVVMLHGQLDVTPVWSVSAPLWGLMIGFGLGALEGPARSTHSGDAGIDPVRAGLATAGLLGVACVLMVRWPTIARWEAGLNRAAVWPARIAEARAELASGKQRKDDIILRALGERVGSWLGMGVVAPEYVEVALDATVARSLGTAAEGLEDALAARPSHTGTRIALGRVLLNTAHRDRARNPDASWDALDRAVASARAGTRLRPSDPDTWSWLGTVAEQRALADAAGDGQDPGVWLDRAADAWMRADALNPHSPSSAARIAEVLARRGRMQQAKDWAVRAIGRDRALRLDPRRQLNPERRGELEGLIRSDGTIGP